MTIQETTFTSNLGLFPTNAGLFEVLADFQPLTSSLFPTVLL